MSQIKYSIIYTIYVFTLRLVENNQVRVTKFRIF